MLPVCLSRSSVDSLQWDRFVDASLQNIIYAHSWYLDVVCDDWNAIVWPPTGDYQIVMPVPIKVKWGHRVIQQPLFCQFLGIFSRFEMTSQHMNDFLTVLSHNYSYISSYYFNPHNDILLQTILPSFSKLKAVPCYTHWLKLDRSFEEISSCYSRDQRRNSRRSNNSQWSIVEGADLDPLLKLFEDNHASRIEGGVDQLAYLLLEEVYEALAKRRLAKVYYAIHSDVIHAGVLLIESDGKTIYLFNAADKTGREGNGRLFILNRYFSQLAGSDHVFDFESPQVHAVAAFYKRFGSTATPFISISKNDLSFPLKEIQNLRKAFLRANK